MNEPKTKQIDGLVVSSSPLPAADAYDLWDSILGAEGQFHTWIAKTENAIRLLASTVVSNGGSKIRIVDRMSFSMAFAGAPFDAARRAALHAFEVTFGNFTDAAKRFADDLAPLASEPAPER